MSADDAEILVCTLGTRGDILPFLALCRPFIEAGHRVTVLTNANWKDLVRSAGAEFYEIAEEDIPQSARDDKAFYRSNTFPSFARSYSFIKHRVSINPRCLVLYRFNMLGAECAAKKFHLPNVKVALQPSVIKSIERPPWPLTQLVNGRLGYMAKKFIIPAVYRIGEITAYFREYTNGFLVEVGLQKLRFGGRLEAEDLFLVLCPDWFALPQKDWPGRSRVTGFLYFDDDHRDGELEAFLEAHGPPIVFTPGTGVSDVKVFFERAVAICQALDAPGVFLSPALRQSGMQWPRRIFVREYASLRRLLPRSQLLVHHGGIGSTAQAIRAGIPQILIPDRFDQPDNALRVAILGLGGAVFSRNPETTELIGLARDILASATVRHQVRSGKELVHAYPSRDVAYHMIKSVMDKHFGGPCLSQDTGRFPRETAR
jgi:rhamnosyltransferase subunit B